MEFQLSQIEEEAQAKKRQLQWQFTLDGAYTESEKNDPTAIMAYCIWNNCMYIRDVVAVRMEMPELLRFIPEFVKRNGYNNYWSKYIELMATDVRSSNAEEGNNVVLDVPPHDDKTAHWRLRSLHKAAGLSAGVDHLYSLR